MPSPREGEQMNFGGLEIEETLQGSTERIFGQAFHQAVSAT